MQFANAETQSYGQRHLANFMQALAPIRHVLEDATVSEIMINAPDDVFVRVNGVDQKLDVRLSEGQIQTGVTLLASLSNKEVGGQTTGDRRSPILSARLPGMRVEAILRPVAVRGPSMCIRRHATRVFSLDEYVERGTVTPDQAGVIRGIVKNRENFMIAGGTNSGKTTLMNCILALVPPDQRLFIIEQVQELKIVAPNHVLVECDPDFGVTARVGVRTAMRYTPNRVIMGELRGAEAYDWLDACGTGHPGSCATIHADNGADSLTRLENLYAMADMGVPYEAMQAQIAKRVDWVLFIESRAENRRVMAEICRIHGYDRASASYQTETFKYGESK